MPLAVLVLALAADLIRIIDSLQAGESRVRIGIGSKSARELKDKAALDQLRIDIAPGDQSMVFDPARGGAAPLVQSVPAFAPFLLQQEAP